MIQESEIRQKLAAVANHKLSVFEFGDWIDSNSWNMHLDSAPSVRKMVSSIHRLFAEYDHSDFDEAQLRSSLLALVQDSVVNGLSIKLSASVSANVLVSLSINFNEDDASDRARIRNSVSAQNLECFVPVLAPL